MAADETVSHLPQSHNSNLTLQVPRHGVVTLYGFGIQVRVDRGHLLLEDGVGPIRCSARLPRVGHGLKRLVVIVGIAGIVRIEEAAKLLADARAKMPMVMKPAAVLLPVEPPTPFPIDAIKETLLREKFDTKHYAFGMGDFEITVITPPLRYRIEGEGDIKAAKEKERRTKKNEGSVQGTFRPLDELKNWAEYVGGYKAVVMVRASAKSSLRSSLAMQSRRLPCWQLGPMKFIWDHLASLGQSTLKSVGYPRLELAKH